MTLIAHSGAYKCNLDTVREVQSPEFTDSWHPISHGSLVDILMGSLDAGGYKVEKEDYALSKDRNQMFATYDLKRQDNGDFALALGLRNSIDKTLSAGLCCGSRVFVCDNLAFSSDIVFTQRHTAEILEKMPLIVQNALGRFSTDSQKQETLFNRMKKVEIPITDAIDTIVEMGEKHKILPVTKSHVVIKEFVNPRFAEFRGQTVWSLLNACTTFCRHDRRDVEPRRNQESLLGIHRVITEKFQLALDAVVLN
jgi:hypothetical protein